MKRLIQVGLLLALCVAFAPGSEARQITFTFKGTVITADGLPICLNEPAVGDEIRCTYTFESDTTGAQDGDIFLYPAVTAASCTVGTLSSEFGPGNIAVGNNIPSEGLQDRYDVYATAPYTADCDPRHFHLNLNDPSGNMLSGTALPLRPPAIPPIPELNSNFSLQVGHDGSVRGLITSLTGPNTPPVAAPTGGGTYEIDASVVLGGTVSDVDGDVLSYQWMEGGTTLPGSTGTFVAPSGGAPYGLSPYTISTLSLGEHTLTLQVSDAINPPVSEDIAVNIMKDNAKPTLAPAPDKTILWPANHKMVTVTILANASDNSGGPVNLSASVASNEPQEGLGDGDTRQDWTTPVIKNGIITLQLRAERSGKGNGRIYTVTIVGTDAAGNAGTAKVNISVPHDMGKGK